MRILFTNVGLMLEDTSGYSRGLPPDGKIVRVTREERPHQTTSARVAVYLIVTVVFGNRLFIAEEYCGDRWEEDVWRLRAEKYNWKTAETEELVTKQVELTAKRWGCAVGHGKFVE